MFDPIAALAEALEPKDRAALEAEYGQVWDDIELAQCFEVEEFFTYHVMMKRRSDGVGGSMRFQEEPRFYFSWVRNNHD